MTNSVRAPHPVLTECAVENCNARVGPRKFVCVRHWRWIPEDIRQAVRLARSRMLNPAHMAPAEEIAIYQGMCAAAVQAAEAAIQNSIAELRTL